MTTAVHRSARRDPAWLLDRLGLGIAALAAVKFVGIWSFVHWDVSMSPWGFLMLFVAPFLIAHALLPRRPRIGAVVSGIPAAVLAVATAVAVITGTEPNTLDYLVVFVGGPLALAAAVLAVRVGLRR